MSWKARSIREERTPVAEAKEVRLQCPYCSGAVYVTLSYPFTAARRQKAISEAIDEHRRLCEKAPPEASRVYRIDYPRA